MTEIHIYFDKKCITLYNFHNNGQKESVSQWLQ